MFLGFNHLAELLYEVDAAHEVDFQDFLVDAEVSVQSLFTLRDACVEYEEVDAQALFNDIVVESVDGAVIVELGLGCPCLHTILLTHLLGFVEVVEAESREDEVTAFLGEMQCYALPNARAAASDEGYFAFQV